MMGIHFLTKCAYPELTRRSVRVDFCNLIFVLKTDSTGQSTDTMCHDGPWQYVADAVDSSVVLFHCFPRRCGKSLVSANFR